MGGGGYCYDCPCVVNPRGSINEILPRVPLTFKGPRAPLALKGLRETSTFL